MLKINIHIPPLDHQIKTIDIPNYKETINISSCNQLVKLNAPNLKDITINYCPHLATLNLPGANYIKIHNSNITTFNVRDVKQIIITYCEGDVVNAIINGTLHAILDDNLLVKIYESSKDKDLYSKNFNPILSMIHEQLLSIVKIRNNDRGILIDNNFIKKTLEQIIINFQVKYKKWIKKYENDKLLFSKFKISTEKSKPIRTDIKKNCLFSFIPYSEMKKILKGFLQIKKKVINNQAVCSKKDKKYKKNCNQCDCNIL